MSAKECFPSSVHLRNDLGAFRENGLPWSRVTFHRDGPDEEIEASIKSFIIKQQNLVCTCSCFLVEQLPQRPTPRETSIKYLTYSLLEHCHKDLMRRRYICLENPYPL